MNYALAKEIYGGGCWAIDAAFIPALLASLKKDDFDINDRKNTFSFFAAISSDSGGSSKTEAKNLISVTDINGVITKAGGNSSTGMKELSGDLILADNNDDFIGHLFIFDTPGGSISGMKYMQGTVRGLQKPKVGIVERDSIAASAGYGILSEMDYTFAENDSAEVGSIGVVSGVSGHKNGTVNGDNEIQYLIYASKSKQKNESSRAAIENDDTSLLLAEADQINDVFHDGIKAKMTNIKDDQMTGAMYPASEVVGTMIHAIGSKKDAVNKILELSKQKNNFNPLNKNQNKAMTAAELLAQHPTVHAEILAVGRTAGVTAGIQQGIDAEKDRVNTWMAYHEIDPEAVTKGVESGKSVSGAEQAQFLVKAAKDSTLAAIKRDSAGNIIPAEAATVIETEKTAKQIADDKEFALSFPLLVKKGITLEKYTASRINAN